LFYLVVVHDLGLVMRPGDGVDDVEGTVAVHRRPVEELPLEQVSRAVSGHVGTLKRYWISNNHRHYWPSNTNGISTMLNLK
jgi:hypothetical protein